MDMTWPDQSGNDVCGAVPEVVQPYVEAIGFDKTAELLMAVGGGRVYLSIKPRPSSMIPSVIGLEAAAKLGKELGPGNICVPIGNVFVARHLRSKGLSVLAIGRKLKKNEKSVRGYLRPDTARDAL